MSTAEIIARCQALYDDLDFTSAREWKEADPSRRVIGYMPVYVPRVTDMMMPVYVLT